MDRSIIYAGQIPLETDQLNQNRATMVALGKLVAAVLGTGNVVSGLSVAPNSPADLNVVIAPGEIYSLQNVDGTAYSALPADTTHTCMKQGLSVDAVTLACTAPTTAGFSINYLIEATFQEVDGSNVVLPYYNASNPTQAYSGPANSGTGQATLRQGKVVLTAKAGIAATTGTQATPTVDAGNVALAVVTVANGQTTINAGNIVAVASTSVLTQSLLATVNANAPGRILSLQKFTTAGSASYVSTPGTNRIRVIVIGGGGGGGGTDTASSTQVTAGGGAGSGTYFESQMIAVPATPIVVTVGSGGGGGAAGLNGSAGGTSSFGTLVSAPGGAAGGAGKAGAGIAPGGGVSGQPTATIPFVVRSPGNAGQVGLALFQSSQTISIGMGGNGGGTPYSGGASFATSNGVGVTAVQTDNPGAGGGGALSKGTSGLSGGGGSPGAVYVLEYS